MYMKRCLPVFFVGWMLLLNSCVVSKKVVYVHDMAPNTSYNAMVAPAVRFQKNDRLSIVIGAKSPELAVPFNQGVTTYQWDDQGNLPAGAASSSSRDIQGYLVDNNGEIEFPILGSLLIEGRTISDVKNLIRQRLVDEKLIADPMIKIELLNLKINMMGEVNKVGVLNVTDQRISLLEAISLSGGLTVNAAADRITVIREENGVRRMVINDIQSREIFNSPTYYLQQNDIVYIEPKDAALTPKAQNNWRYISTGIGLVATIFTILNLLK
jgi:polysaccharide export outer membrane protein